MDRNSECLKEVETLYVVPYVGTWIEIIKILRRSRWIFVVPYVGTWIEILPYEP